MKKELKGFYVCHNCTNEVISDFPYETVRCANCGEILHKEKEITEEDEKKIKANWQIK